MEDFAISITNKLLTNAAAGSIIGSSVVSFATSPILESDYTTNTSVTLNALASLSYTGGFTDHGGAISTCQSTLPPGEKNFILLVTDGLPTVGSDPTGIGISSATAAKGDGTTIIPVYITGDPLPSSTQTYLQGLSSDGSFYSKDFDELNGRLVRNVADELERSMQFAGALQIIVTFVGIGTLIAGIIGISNIMVFIVKERTKELGIRKALGAQPNEIIKMILTESIFITSISGFAGMIVGIVVLNSLDSSLHQYFITRPEVSINLAFIATLVLIIFGVIAGYIPAKRAAKIKPIIALRDE